MFAALSLAGSQKRRWPARFAALLAIVVITGARVAGAADGPWMNEDQMRAAFSGVTLEGKYGSGKPFTEVYEKDGSLQYRETQTVIGGKWSVEARYALFSNEFATRQLTFRRQIFYAGTVYRYR